MIGPTIYVNHGRLADRAAIPAGGEHQTPIGSRPNRHQQHRPDTEFVAILSHDVRWARAVSAELAAFDCRAEIIDVDGNGSLRDRLSNSVRKILCEARCRAVISEAVFIDDHDQRITIAEPLIDTLPRDAGSIVSQIVGAGLPLLVNIDSSAADMTTVWASAAAGAKPAVRGRLYDDLRASLADMNTCVRRREFDVQNNFARDYDRSELENPATAMAVHYENDYVAQAVRDYAESSIDPIRILDIGCGSGRFEEILLSDADLANRIEQIVAVDFAPEHLRRAQRRITSLLGAAERSKIIWLRRLAQNLQWPPGYFDVVIAGFAVVSFADPIRVLQQAHRVLKPGGIFVGSAYNKKAAVYDFRKQIAERPGADRFPAFAARVDPEDGLLILPDGNSIACQTVDPDEFKMVTRLAGLAPLRDKIRTFPILSGNVRRAYLDRLSGRTDQTLDDVDVHGGDRPRSYQNRNLHVDPVLWAAELDFQRVMPNNGVYVYLTAIR